MSERSGLAHFEGGVRVLTLGFFFSVGGGVFFF